MYGYLNFDIRRPATPWTAHYFALPGAEDVEPTEDAKRKRQADIVVNVECRALSAEQKTALSNQIYGALKFLPRYMEDVSFELYAALAHFRLEPEVQKQRTARIEALLELDCERSDLPSVKEHGRRLAAMAVMVPDAALNVVVRSQVIHIHRSLANTVFPSNRINPSRAFYDQVCKASGWDETSEFVEALHACHFGRPATERVECLTLIVQQLADKKVQQWLPGLIRALAAREQDLLIADKGDSVFSMLMASQTHSEGNFDDLVAYEVEKFVARRSVRAMQIVDAIQAAIAAKTPFDAASTKKNFEALAAYDLAVSRTELAMTPARLRSTFAQPRKPAAPLQSNVQPPDLDPVHARSVEWLVQWIQGSDAKPSAPVRIDRRKVVKEEQALRAKARKATQMSKEDQTKDQDLTEKDVDLVVQSGLSSTAEFFLRDIEETAVRAKHLNMEPRLLEDCMQYSDRLNALSRQPITDEPAAIALLHKAEAAINELRANIKSVDVAASLRRKFAHFLNEALDREPLVYGKRHGGVIACPMREADWPWVHGEFHHRWLNVRRIEIDGLQVPLQPHQALALYVTGSSLSNYAFDVSVHLWIRKDGCKNSPTTDNSAWMDNEAWLDTRIPCAVLHVPPAT